MEMEKKIKESERLELKKSTSELKEAIVSMVAILNKNQKGEIYFGVKNNGEVAGQTIGERTIRDISKSISDYIEPKVFPKIKEVVLENKKCVCVEFSGNEQPYYAYGRAYIRVGDEDKKLSAKELENLILKKNKDKLRWDGEVCEEASFRDIDIKRLKWFLKESDKEHGSIGNSLEKLGLVKDGKLINAAVMLFGKKPQQFFPNAKLRCAVFATAETSLIVDRQEFEGNLFDLIKKAEEYVLKNIHIGMRLEGMRRVDVPEIDKDAFREAIINAFCHRNYYEYDSVNIAIFKDRLEIRSPGALYGGLTIRQIKKEKISKRRNEIIANMFHEVHFVEKWGRGISLILSKEPNANFKEVADIFITMFKRPSYVKEVTPQVTPQVELTLLENKIFGVIKSNSKISRSELSKKFGMSKDTVKEYLKRLREKGILRRVGKTSAGYWEILK
ncbi:putative DNA binding domain-containing protein [Candidatus Pacearchaeota archaeon]|nr:putative DNA binding domain-containing protein [Candidatus Pacearchaeota archaeon]